MLYLEGKKILLKKEQAHKWEENHSKVKSNIKMLYMNSYA